MKTIYIHAGLQKTGTSSIQETLFQEENNKKLREVGYDFPKSWNTSNHSIPIYGAFCDNPENYQVYVNMGLSKEEIENKIERDKKVFLEQLRNENTENIILSGESIPQLNVKSLLSLKEFIEDATNDSVIVQIIIYVRNPATWLVSSFQQRIIGAVTTEEENINVHEREMQMIFTDRIGRFYKIFGAQNVKVYDFESAVKHRYSVAGHFLSSVGVKENVLKELNYIKSNSSISQIAADILMFGNEKMAKNKEQFDRVKMSADKAILKTINGRKFKVDPFILEKLYKSAYDNMLWLKEQTGIDYLNYEIDLNKNEENFTKTQSYELLEIYKRVSAPMQEIIKGYLQEKEANCKTPEDQVIVKEMLKQMTSVR